MKPPCGLAIALAIFTATAAAAQPTETSLSAQPHASPEAAAAPTRSGAALSSADVEAWLDGAIPYALERADAAGAVVAVVKDGRPLLVRGYGHGAAAAGRALTRD